MLLLKLLIKVEDVSFSRKDKANESLHNPKNTKLFAFKLNVLKNLQTFGNDLHAKFT